MLTLTTVKRAVAGALVMFGVVIATPMSSEAAPPSTPGGAQDTVVVTGDGQLAYSKVNIAAQSGASGENPTGSGSFTVVGSISISGPVTCLRVTGPDAGAGRPGSPTTAVLNLEDPIWGVVTVQVVDNGGVGADQINTNPIHRAPTDCSPLFVGISDVLTGGRATVFDAPLVPTAKEQCKNGGYALFHFGNQGQCIAFVNQHQHA